MRCSAISLEEYITQVGTWLRREPVLHTVLLSVSQSKVDGTAPSSVDDVWLRVEDDTYSSTAPRVVGAAMRTPPHGAHLSLMTPDAARVVAEYFAKSDRTLPSIGGPAEPAEWCARHYGELIEQAPTPGMVSRLYELGTLIPATGVPGIARSASHSDRDLLVSWANAFHAEANPNGPAVDFAVRIDGLLTRKNLIWLWEDNHKPISMAWLTEPVNGMTRIGGVYTPPTHRGRGYASACVTAVSQHAEKIGAKHRVLYADLANPTTNKIYPALGFRKVADFQDWHFA